MDEETASVIKCLCVWIVILVLGIFYLSNSRTRTFVENGYTKQTLQGSECPQWVKEK